MMPRSHSFAISLNRPPKWRDKVRDRMAPSLSRHCSRQNGGRGLAETGLFSAFAVIAFLCALSWPNNIRAHQRSFAVRFFRS